MFKKLIFVMTLAMILMLSACTSTGHSQSSGVPEIKPYIYEEFPGYPSYAVRPAESPDLPEIRSAEGGRYIPVDINPAVPSSFPETLKVYKELRIPDPAPVGIAWDGKNLWVAGRVSRSIYKMNPDTGRILKQTPAPGSFPTSLCWADGGLWHTDAKERKIFRIENSRVTKEFSVDWQCVGISKYGDYLAVSDWDSDIIRLVSPETGEVVKKVRAPADRIWGLSSDGNCIWTCYRDTIILHDMDRELPVTGFGLSERDDSRLDPSDIALTEDGLWFADLAYAKLVFVERPSNGQ